jgi:hypothetical protein
MRVRPSHRQAVALVDILLASGEVAREPVGFDLQSRQWIVRADITLEAGTGPRPGRGAAGHGYNADPATATFAGPPTVGNTLLAAVGTGAPRSAVALSAGGVDVTGDWTLLPGGVDGSSSLNVWAKAATADDTELTATAAGSSGTNLILIEYTRLPTADLAAMVDKVASAQAASNVETLSVGPTAALAQANTLCLLILDSIWGRTSPDASGAYERVASGDQDRMVLFDTDPMATTAQSSVLTWAGAHYANAILLTLKAVSPAAGNRNPEQYASGFVEFAVADDPAPPLPALPAAPLGLAAAAGATSVGVTWNGVPGATGYILYENTVPVFTVNNYIIYGDSSLALTSVQGTLRDGLPPGSYSYQVSATNRTGEGPKSGAVVAVVVSAAPTVQVVDSGGVLQPAALDVLDPAGMLAAVTGLQVR